MRTTTVVFLDCGSLTLRTSLAHAQKSILISEVMPVACDQTDPSAAIDPRAPRPLSCPQLRPHVRGYTPV
jgi:hypothetical protein